MPILTTYQIEEIEKHLVNDPTELKALHRTKKIPVIRKSVLHSDVEYWENRGWRKEGQPLKTKTKMVLEKTHDHHFEDSIWTQLFELGYTKLSYDNQLKLPFSKNPEDKKQIDILAVSDDSILVVECKSSSTPKKAQLRESIEALRLRIDGHSKVLREIFGDNRKIKFILATRLLKIPTDSTQGQVLQKAKVFHYSDKHYAYVNSLIKNYRKAARYQFLGMLYQGELISKERIEIPCIQGSMGAKKYYMFSIEPHTLLKLGFVLHRTKANTDIEDPAYQRLLVPSRLNKITEFIDNGGYFPNSIIINFKTDKRKLEFKPAKGSEHSDSKTGILYIPNAYSIAYIIDGQHRVYGYANSRYLKTNTIPVVAFDGLSRMNN